MADGYDEQPLEVCRNLFLKTFFLNSTVFIQLKSEIIQGLFRAKRAASLAKRDAELARRLASEEEQRHTARNHSDDEQFAIEVAERERNRQEKRQRQVKGNCQIHKINSLMPTPNTYVKCVT